MGDWCLIESDPGVFTELVEKIGVKGVQFEEVYDVDMLPREKLYGLVFLFKCEKGIYPRQPLGYVPSGLFFAKQVIQNACATQAILSVLLNADIKHLGKDLTEFKSFTTALDPEMKGLAISNQETIRTNHNSFSRQSSFDFVHEEDDDKEDSFHFISYVCCNNKVYELDGLQNGPIEIGQVEAGKNWVDVVSPEIRNRIAKYQEKSTEIRFNLLALTEDNTYLTELEIEKQQHLRQRANIKMISFGEDIDLDDEVDDDDCPEGVTSFEDLPEDIEQLKKIASEATSKITNLGKGIEDYTQRRKKWKKENSRRRHDYVPFILAAMKHLAKNGTLVDAYNKGKVVAEKAATDKKAREEAAKAEKAK